MSEDATPANDTTAAAVTTAGADNATPGSSEGNQPSSTPRESSESTSQAGQESGGSTKQDDSANRAQAADRQAEIDRRALVALDDGKSVDDARKMAREPEPASTQAAQEGLGQPTQGEKPSGNAATQQQPADGTSYEGLDASARQALSQTHLLPDAESWKGMPAKFRDALVASARDLVAGRTRDFQRQAAQTAPRNERGQFQPMPAPTQQAPADNTQANGQGTQAQDSTKTPPAGTQADNRANPTSLRGMDKLKKFADELGPELAAPLLEGLQEIDGDRTAAFQQMEQKLSQVAQGSQYALQRLVAQEESTARATLAKEIPAVNDAAKWDEVKANAKVFAQAAYSSGANFTWEDSLMKAGRALFSQDMQQQAQKKLADRRTTSLQGTPERGTEQAKPSRGMSKDDWDRAALDALESGKSVEDVRAMRH